MNLSYYLRRLTNQAEAIARLTEGVDDEQARWRPTAGEWSIVEVVNHLYDEEIEDFRIRLQNTLRDPNEEWTPNDPVRKVTARDYNGRQLPASLENFLDERTVSLEWLRGLHAAKWDNEHAIPGVGSLTAGDLLAAWVAHDLLHLRQLVELQFHYQRQLARPYSVDYAGDW
jgi:DinB superfamily